MFGIKRLLFIFLHVYYVNFFESDLVLLGREVTTPATTTTEKWIPRVAPEDPEHAKNRGGFRFRPHEDSELDITRRRGEVKIRYTLQTGDTNLKVT